jgi:hypothetical protein
MVGETAATTLYKMDASAMNYVGKVEISISLYKTASSMLSSW